MTRTLQAGLVHRFSFVVPATKTVPMLYPEATAFRDMPNVLATGFLVGLLEWACMQAIEPFIDATTQLTLGTHIDVSHRAATPPGLEVQVRVVLVRVSGRRLRFEVEAHDGIDIVSSGSHERTIVDRHAFDERVRRKAGRA